MVYTHWSDYPADKWRWKNFRPEEMACRGTGKLMVDERAMDMLQRLRDKIGAPFIVNSAYRSPEHNRAVGGAKKSRHMDAIAFDISMANHDPATFIEEARALGFGGVGTYPGSNFVHIDARDMPAAWGEPFPPRRHRFEHEPVVAEREGEKRDAGGIVKGGATATATAVALDVVANGGGLISAIGNLNPVAQTVLAAAGAGAIGFVVYKRMIRGKG